MLLSFKEKFKKKYGNFPYPPQIPEGQIRVVLHHKRELQLQGKVKVKNIDKPESKFLMKSHQNSLIPKINFNTKGRERK